jgi:hypothetical protein
VNLISPPPNNDVQHVDSGQQKGKGPFDKLIQRFFPTNESKQKFLHHDAPIATAGAFIAATSLKGSTEFAEDALIQIKDTLIDKMKKDSVIGIGENGDYKQKLNNIPPSNISGLSFENTGGLAQSLINSDLHDSLLRSQIIEWQSSVEDGIKAYNDGAVIVIQVPQTALDMHDSRLQANAVQISTIHTDGDEEKIYKTTFHPDTIAAMRLKNPNEPLSFFFQFAGYPHPDQIPKNEIFSGSPQFISRTKKVEITLCAEASPPKRIDKFGHLVETTYPPDFEPPMATPNILTVRTNVYEPPVTD